MKTITFASVKGGTGKSTLSIMTALTLKEQGFKVISIDLDPQNSTSFFYADNLQNKNIFNVLMLNDKIENNIINTKYGVSLLASDLKLLDCRTIETNRIKPIFKKLSELEYDYCIIDTAPTFDSLTINSYHADTIIIPAVVDIFTAKTCHFLISKLSSMENDSNIGIALNCFKPSKSENLKNWKNIEASIFYQDEVLKEYLVNSYIPRSDSYHRLIAEEGYILKGKALENIKFFVEEITEEKINIDSIGGIL